MVRTCGAGVCVCERRRGREKGGGGEEERDVIEQEIHDATIRGPAVSCEVC
jgi:hypothetical protein